MLKWVPWVPTKNKEKLSKMKQKETETNSAGEPEIL